MTSSNRRRERSLRLIQDCANRQIESTCGEAPLIEGRDDWRMTPLADNGPIIRRIAIGAGAPIVVADFQAFSTAPRLSEGIAERINGRPVYQADAVGLLSRTRSYLGLSELATACVSELGAAASVQDRVFVIGHCSAAGLALHISRRLMNATTILVEPTWPDSEHVSSRFADFQRSVGTTVLSCPDLNDEPLGILAEMERVLRDGLAAAAVARGVSATSEVFADLLSWYRAWLAFLLACRNDAPAGESAEVGAVRILTHDAGEIACSRLNPAACDVIELPVSSGSITPELTDHVVAQLGQAL